MLSPNEMMLLGQVGDANRTSAEWEGNARQWQQHAAGLERDLAETKRKLDIETAHAEALLAKMRAVVDALRKIDPKNAVFTQTGAFYADGRPEDKSSLIYASTFDASLKAKGYEKPSQFRHVAMTPQQRRDAMTPQEKHADFMGWLREQKW